MMWEPNWTDTVPTSMEEAQNNRFSAAGAYWDSLTLTLDKRVMDEVGMNAHFTATNEHQTGVEYSLGSFHLHTPGS